MSETKDEIVGPKRASYFRTTHTVGTFAEGAIVTREELQDRGASVKRLLALKAIAPLWDDQGAALYAAQQERLKREAAASTFTDDDEDDEDEFAALRPTAAAVAEPETTEEPDDDEDAPVASAGTKEITPPNLEPDPAKTEEPTKEPEKAAEGDQQSQQPAVPAPTDYAAMSAQDLKSLGISLGVANAANLGKADLIAAITAATK